MTVKIDGTNTEANPAFTGADTDTGLQCGTNELKLVTGGTARATVDSSGNLRTPEKQDVVFGVDVNTSSGDGGDLTVKSGNGSGSGNDSGNLYLAAGRGSSSANSGFTAFGIAQTTNTSGLNVEHARFNSDGNFGIGTTSINSNEKFIVHGGDSSIYVPFARSDTKWLSFHSGSTDPAMFCDTGGALRFGHGDARNNFSNERMRIDTDGRLLLGNTSPESTDSSIETFKNSGENHVRCVSNSMVNGQYSMFRAAGTASGGSIRQAFIGIYKHSGITNAAAFMLLEQEDGGNSYYWTDNSGKLRTSTANSNIGTSGGTIIGTQTSDLRLKNVGANVSYGLAEVKQLQPKQYALKTEPDVNKLGFIAQEVESIIPEAVFDTLEELDGHQEGDRTKLGMEYVQLIPVLVNAIKELSAEVDTLKTKVATLEAAE